MKLELEAIGKTVGGEPHLYPMSLTLEAGLSVLLGPTRAGKTSLMRLIAGLDRPSEGHVRLNGRDVTGVPVQRRSVAFVYQQFINYPSLTVFENIASPLRVRGGLSRAQIAQHVARAAQAMRIEPLLGRLPAELSGGQQQRTAIARALVKEADVLLMDEPLVNLDYKLREELRLELRNIFSARDAIVVYATTEPFEALLLGGTTAVLDAGRLLQSGPTLEVYHHPDSQRVGEVFSDPPINVLSATVEGGQVRLAAGVSFGVPEHMRALSPGPYRLGLRANHARFSRSSPGDVAVPMTVELAEISGSETFVHVKVANGERVADGEERVVALLGGVHPFELGTGVTLHFSPAQLFAFGGRGALAAAPPRHAASPIGGA